MPLPEVFHSSPFRAAVGITMATSIATLLIFGFVYLQITNASEATVRRVLADEAEKGATYSDDEIRRAIDLRLTRDLRRLDYVALFDAGGRLAMGNIAAMPAIAVDGASHFVAAVKPLGNLDADEPAIFVARKRRDGGVLLLGRSLVEVYALRRTVLLALATAAVPALALAFLIGGFFARRTSRRLNRIHDSIVRVMDGDLQARLPVLGAPDEIARVSRDVNVMLDEISRLVSQIKSVGDNIAHDLRASIAIVRAKLERAVGDADDRAARVAAHQALGELDKAMVTIAALLRMAEIEHMPRSEAFKPVDLAAICADLFDFYEPVGRAKSIAMTLEATPPVPSLGDGDLLREALANLIDNAIKFTDAGGAVRVQAAMEAGKPVVRVYDDGVGVAPGDRVKIFDRFYRSGASGRIPGSGLGLSIAAAIANLHDFELTVGENRPGSVFEMSPRGPVRRGAR